LETPTLEQKLKAVIGNLPPDGVTLAEIRDLIGQDGLLLLTVLLALVFMVPVSIPGFSTIFGAAILLIGLSRLLNRKLWLPGPIAQRVVPSDRLHSVLNHGGKWLRRMEGISRPQRLQWMSSTGMTAIINNGALVTGAVLLMAPFGMIPFSNTLPAIALLLLAIGLMQRDGLCILLGHFINLTTVVYFAILLLGGGAAVREAFRYLAGNPS